jgi:hypothetical protein
MNLCKNCKFLKPSMLLPADLRRCTNPKNNYTRRPTDGKAQEPTFASIVRVYHGCGPDGKWFEPKIGLFKRLFGGS